MMTTSGTRNIVLMLTALSIATALSVLSFSISQTVYVYAKLNSPNGPETCVQLSVQCNDSPTLILCRISVPVISSYGLQTANSTASGTVYRTWRAGCTVELFDAENRGEQLAIPILEEGDVIYWLLVH